MHLTKCIQPVKHGKGYFIFLTWFTQGSSFLVPRAYAVMHRMHHEYSDTEQDPHSPHFFKDVWHMMLHTAKIYQAFITGKIFLKRNLQGNISCLAKLRSYWL